MNKTNNRGSSELGKISNELTLRFGMLMISCCCLLCPKLGNSLMALLPILPLLHMSISSQDSPLSNYLMEELNSHWRTRIVFGEPWSGLVWILTWFNPSTKVQSSIADQYDHYVYSHKESAINYLQSKVNLPSSKY